MSHTCLCMQKSISGNDPNLPLGTDEAFTGVKNTNADSSHVFPINLSYYPASNPEASLSGSTPTLLHRSPHIRSPFPEPEVIHAFDMPAPPMPLHIFANSSSYLPFEEWPIPLHPRPSVHQCTLREPFVPGFIVLSSSLFLASDRTSNKSCCILRTYSGVSPFLAIMPRIFIMLIHVDQGT